MIVHILFGMNGSDPFAILGVFKCKVAAERRRNRIQNIKYKTDKGEDYPYCFDNYIIHEYGVKK